jgi:hypothetical protein
MLIFELGSGCNLGNVHPACPNRSDERFAGLDVSRELDDATIIDAAEKAYRELGFAGVIGWHYYNEPLMQSERMFALMARIKETVPDARFLLWTNGTLLPADCSRFAAFDAIVVTKYAGQSYGDLQFHPRIHVRGEGFDDRMIEKTPLGDSPCTRPLVECIFDAYGNHHPCCNDWRGVSSLGNIFVDGFAAIAASWREFQEAAFRGELTPGCCKCGVRYRDIQAVDRRSIENIARWIENQTKGD